MDDERLKNGGSVLTVEYFDRLLEQIREIVYQSVGFIRRLRILCYPRLIMTVLQIQQSSFSQRFKIKCIMRYMGILRQS